MENCEVVESNELEKLIMDCEHDMAYLVVPDYLTGCESWEQLVSISEPYSAEMGMFSEN